MSTNSMSTLNKNPRRQPVTGVGRLVRRLDRERRRWVSRSDQDGGPLVPTEVAWRAGVAEGLRLAQVAIRRGV